MVMKSMGTKEGEKERVERAGSTPFLRLPVPSPRRSSSPRLEYTTSPSRGKQRDVLRTTVSLRDKETDTLSMLSPCKTSPGVGRQRALARGQSFDPAQKAMMAAVELAQKSLALDESDDMSTVEMTSSPALQIPHRKESKRQGGGSVPVIVGSDEPFVVSKNRSDSDNFDFSRNAHTEVNSSVASVKLSTDSAGMSSDYTPFDEQRRESKAPDCTASDDSSLESSGRHRLLPAGSPRPELTAMQFLLEPTSADSGSDDSTKEKRGERNTTRGDTVEISPGTLSKFKKFRVQQLEFMELYARSIATNPTAAQMKNILLTIGKEGKDNHIITTKNIAQYFKWRSQQFAVSAPVLHSPRARCVSPQNRRKLRVGVGGDHASEAQPVEIGSRKDSHDKLGFKAKQSKPSKKSSYVL